MLLCLVSQKVGGNFLPISWAAKNSFGLVWEGVLVFEGHDSMIRQLSSDHCTAGSALVHGTSTADPCLSVESCTGRYLAKLQHCSSNKTPVPTALPATLAQAVLLLHGMDLESSIYAGCEHVTHFTVCCAHCYSAQRCSQKRVGTADIRMIELS